MKFNTNTKSILIVTLLTIFCTLSLIKSESNLKTAENNLKYNNYNNNNYYNHYNNRNYYNRNKANIKARANANATFKSKYNAGKTRAAAYTNNNNNRIKSRKSPVDTNSVQPEVQNANPNLQQGGKAELDKVVSAKAEWEKIFNNPNDRPKSMCKNPIDIRMKAAENEEKSKDSAQQFLPKRKPNRHYKKFGFESSSYLFDYIDPVFQAPVVTKFDTLWKQATSAADDTTVKNQYAPASLLSFYYQHGGADKLGAPPTDNMDPKAMAENLKKFNGAINPEIMMAGVTIPKLASVIKTLKIDINEGKVGWQKAKLDQYDFNGDGTLSAEEYIFFIIWEKREGLCTPELFKDMCDQYFIPMFEYMDCNNDGLVNAEALWAGLKNFKRPVPTEYNIYNEDKCVDKNGEPKRTASMNDFVLKNEEKTEAYLSLNEFIKGILLGYWDRQINDNTIYNAANIDGMNIKGNRWKEKTVDVKC